MWSCSLGRPDCLRLPLTRLSQKQCRTRGGMSGKPKEREGLISKICSLKLPKLSCLSITREYLHHGDRNSCSGLISCRTLHPCDRVTLTCLSSPRLVDLMA